MKTGIRHQKQWCKEQSHAKNELGLLTTSVSSANVGDSVVA